MGVFQAMTGPARSDTGAYGRAQRRQGFTRVARRLRGLDRASARPSLGIYRSEPGRMALLKCEYETVLWKNLVAATMALPPQPYRRRGEPTARRSQGSKVGTLTVGKLPPVSRAALYALYA